MINNSPIGFFDSGVGGLSVLSKFRELLPNENIIYYGDLKNLPYGNKSQAQIIGFSKKILDFFEKQNVKAVVIACNTSSALAYESVRDHYRFKLYPVLQTCAGVVSSLPIQKVGVFATEGTVKSEAYTRELTKNNSTIKVKEIACPNWVKIVENLEPGLDSESDIKLKLGEMLKFNPDKIILGCTHYPFLISTLTKYAPHNLFINPADIFAEYIKSDLEKNNLLNASSSAGKEKFYVSANPEAFKAHAKIFYSINEEVNLI